jgi:hypothetical protein
MSVKVMSRVWAHSQRKDGELLVLLALADFSNDAGESWPSLKVLAQKARLTRRQTIRVLKKLEQVGEIRKSPSNGGRNRRNHYFITLPKNGDIITLKKCHPLTKKGDTGVTRNVDVDVTRIKPSFNRHKESLKPKPSNSHNRPSKDADPRVKQFIDYWHAEFLQSFKERYHFTGKDAALIQNLLATYELERLQELAVKFLETQDDWIRKAGFTIGVFASRINTLVSTSAKMKERHSLSPIV